ncbi:MAG TPA: hypothetical protein VK255_04650, partial [Patescibacteria group bacterium]|nr:hypothetical protein [Patescibacteria group bacterium]
MLFDFNYFLIIVIYIAAFASLVSGAVLVFLSYFGFRAHINQSMNLDLEIIRVSKPEKRENMSGGQQTQQQVWKEEIGAMEQLLTSLSSIKDTRGIFAKVMYGSPSISFEIANSAKDEEIIFYVAVPKKFHESIEKQINSFFPNALLEKANDYNIFFPGSFTAASYLKLKNKYMLPLKTYETMEIDPLNAITNAMSKLETVKEGASIQIVLRPAGISWRSKGKKIAHKMQQGKRLSQVQGSVLYRETVDMGDRVIDLFNPKGDKNTSESKPVNLTPEEQDLVKSIENKSSKTGFKANIRLVASAATQERAEIILGQLENSFSQYENGNINCFQTRRVGKKEIAYNYIFRNFIEEESIILNNEEIASIFHLPVSVTDAPRIKWLKSNAAAPPVGIPEQGIILGFNDFRGEKTTIKISDTDRRRHLYAIGQTGTGKSNFLQEMAKQDAREGRGFCFIDPHGDAIEDILAAIPKERAENVIVFDPSDIERPFGLNM